MGKMEKLSNLKGRVSKNLREPCKCCGVSNAKGTQLFAIFDIITGLILFAAALAILLYGDKYSKYYPVKKVNIPREVVLFLAMIGFYNASTALLLYFSVGCKNMGGCYAWLILNFPFNFVDPLKIYQSLIVYGLAQEILEEDRARGFFFDQVETRWTPPKKSRKVIVKSCDEQLGKCPSQK